MYINVNTYVYTCIHTYKYIHVTIYIYILCIYASIHTCTYIYVCMYIFLYISACVRMCEPITRSYVHVLIWHTQSYRCIRAHIHIYMRTKDT